MRYDFDTFAYDDRDIEALLDGTVDLPNEALAPSSAAISLGRAAVAPQLAQLARESTRPDLARHPSLAAALRLATELADQPLESRLRELAATSSRTRVHALFTEIANLLDEAPRTELLRALRTSNDDRFAQA